MAFTEGFWAADTEGNVGNMNACLLGWGPKADFPAAAAGNKGRVAYATDESLTYYSDGSAWQVQNPRASGQYTGNDSANRGIAHGLGVIPKFVCLYPATGNATIMVVGINGQGRIISSTDFVNSAVTAPDATNFYVGNAASYQYSGNANATVYDWFAIG